MVHRAGASLVNAKAPLGVDVLTAARERIAWVMATIPRVYVSVSGGKDSTVLLHLTCDEARRVGRRVGVLVVDLEGQYKLTIDHLQALVAEYADCIDLYWCCLPLHLRNAVSQFEPQWICWEPGREADWIRQPPAYALTDQARFPFYRYAMEFEEFVPAFGRWYGGGLLTACLVGIRADESLNRWRTIKGGRKKALPGTPAGASWTTWMGEHLYNAYPLYDWKARDIWIYHGRHPGQRYNALYDRMHQAGLTINQMQTCQPYGDDQRRGLWLFHVVEPETWGRVVARVSGANQGALYAREQGNMLGNGAVTLPPGHTWHSFSLLLLASMPPPAREHYENKIAVFLQWYAARGFPGGIPDATADVPEALRQGERHGGPSWQRICKALLRHDYWMKGLSFSPHRTDAYDRYKQLMKRRRERWSLVDLT